MSGRGGGERREGGGGAGREREGGARVARNAVCTYCGCTCDDIDLHIADGAIARAERACREGEEWFSGLPANPDPAARVDGEPAGLEEALDAAAELLSGARAPLVFGLCDASTEAQGFAVEIADRLRGTLDIAGSLAGAPWVSALQRDGSTSATFAEVKNRADLIVLWYVDPEASHPRFAERFLEPEGLYVSGPRTVVEVRAPGDPASELADHTIELDPERAFEALWRLRRALVADAAEDRDTLAGLRDRLLDCRYGAWIYDPAGARTDAGLPHAIFSLVSALNDHVPFASVALGDRGNARGAESVLTAQTGYPFAVSFAAGYPRFGPGEFHGERVLERGEADAVLLIGCDPEADLPGPAVEALRSLPVVAVDFRDTKILRDARAALRCAPYGVAAPAVVHRSDGIALRARPALESPLPSDAAILHALADRLADRSAAGSAAAGETEAGS